MDDPLHCIEDAGIGTATTSRKSDMDVTMFLVGRADSPTEQSDAQLLAAIDQAAASLLKQNLPEKALQYLEEGLRVRKALYGDRSTEAVVHCRGAVRKTVALLSKKMERGDAAAQVLVLQRLESIIGQFPVETLVPERCDVYNSLSYCYRRLRKLTAAKQYILQALKLSTVYKDAEVDRAAICLNMCAVLDRLGQHQEALEFALKAVQTAQEDLLHSNLSKQEISPHRMTLLAVAYHNAGMQEEHLQHYESAISWYEKALRYIQQPHDPSKAVFLRLEKTFLNALKSAQAKAEVAANVPAKRAQSATKTRPQIALKLKSPNRVRIDVTSPRAAPKGVPKIPRPKVKRIPLSPREMTAVLPDRRLARDRTYSPGDQSAAFPSPTRSNEQHWLERSLDALPKDTKSPRLKLRLGSPRSARDSPRGDVISDFSHFPLIKENAQGKETLSRSGTPKHSSDGSSHTFIFPFQTEDSAPFTPQTAALPSSGSSTPSADKDRVPWSATVKPLTLDCEGNVTDESAPLSVEKEDCGKGNGERSVRITAAKKIQARVRRLLATLKFRAMRLACDLHKRRTLMKRCGRKFQNGSYGLVSIYQIGGEMAVEVVWAGGESTAKRFPAIPPVDTALRLDLSASRELTLLPSLPADATPPIAQIIRIQSFIRRTLSRIYTRLRKIAKARGRTVVLRAGRKLNGQYVLLHAVRDQNGLSMVWEADNLATPVPAHLATLSPHYALEQVRVRDGALYFPEGSDPASPPAPRESSRTLLSFATMLSTPKEGGGLSGLRARKPRSIEVPKAASPVSPATPSSLCPSPLLSSNSQKSVEPAKYDQGKVTLIQSTFRMQRAKTNYKHLLSKPDQSIRLIQRVVPLLAAQYLVSISKLRLDSSVIEVEAYALAAGSARLQSSEYREEAVKERYQWADEVESHGEELFRDIEIIAGTTIALRRMASSKSGGLRHSDRSQQPGSADSQAASIRIIEPQQMPTIQVFATTEENQLSTLGYHRNPSPVSSIHSISEAAVIIIQKYYRRHLAKQSARDAAIARKIGLKYRVYRLFPEKRPFSVRFVRQSSDVTQILAADLILRKTYSVTLRAGVDYDSLNFAEVSKCLWTKANGALGVFILEKTTAKHEKAALFIERVAKGWLTRVKLKRNKGEKKMGMCAIKEFAGGTRGVAAYFYNSRVAVECFPLRKEGKKKKKSATSFFHTKELNELYPPQFDLSTLLSDVLFEHEKVWLRAKRLLIEAREQALLSANTSSDIRSIIRTSRRLDDKMWVVTMRVIGASDNMLNTTEDDIVEFSAFCSSHQIPIKTKTTVGELARLTRLSADNILPIGTLTIQRLLQVKDGGLVINETMQVPDVTSLITFIQAHVRGFVTRRKMMSRHREKSMLISCTIAPLDGSQWILYASREPPFIKLEAVHRVSKARLSTFISDNIFSRFPPTLSRKRITDNFIFPKLHLVNESGTRHLRITKSMQLQQSVLEKYHSKIRVITGKINVQPKTEEAPPVITVLNADLEEILKEKQQDIESLKAIPPEADSPKLSVLPQAEESQHNSTLSLSFLRGTLDDQKPDKDEEMVEPAQSFLNGVFSPRRDKRRDTRKTSRKETRKPTLPPAVSQEIDKSLSQQNLILRSGTEIDGLYYLVSIFGDRLSLLIELTDSQTQEKAERRWSLEREEVKNLDEYCVELLNRLRVVRSEDGQMNIHVIMPRDVLYKKSHYISNRYCVVTVFSDAMGLAISALDPEKTKTYELRIGHRPQKTSEALQREMADLVKKLRITDLLGEEALSLSSEQL